MAKQKQGVIKLKKNEVRKALYAAGEAADKALQEYKKENPEWAKNLEGIKSRRDHQLDKLVVTN